MPAEPSPLALQVFQNNMLPYLTYKLFRQLIGQSQKAHSVR